MHWANLFCVWSRARHPDTNYTILMHWCLRDEKLTCIYRQGSWKKKRAPCLGYNTADLHGYAGSFRGISVHFVESWWVTMAEKHKKCNQNVSFFCQPFMSLFWSKCLLSLLKMSLFSANRICLLSNKNVSCIWNKNVWAWGFLYLVQVRYVWFIVAPLKQRSAQCDNRAHANRALSYFAMPFHLHEHHLISREVHLSACMTLYQYGPAWPKCKKNWFLWAPRTGSALSHIACHETTLCESSHLQRLRAHDLLAAEYVLAGKNNFERDGGVHSLRIMRLGVLRLMKASLHRKKVSLPHVGIKYE